MPRVAWTGVASCVVAPARLLRFALSRTRGGDALQGVVGCRRLPPRRVLWAVNGFLPDGHPPVGCCGLSTASEVGAGGPLSSVA